MPKHWLVALVAISGFGIIGLWVYLSQPAPQRDTIKHIASTKPMDLAVQLTKHATGHNPLAVDLATREGADWPGFLGLAGDGKSPEKGIRPWFESGPKVIWSVAAGEGYSAPAVCRGRLLLFDRVKDDARCRCLNSETGKELWQFTYHTDFVDRQGYDGGPRAGPVTDGQRVYLHGPEGMLHCLRLDDGELLWKIDTFATFGVVQNLFGAGSTPVIDENRVILQVGGSPVGSTDRDLMNLRSNGSCLVAFSKATGKILYQCGEDLASYASPQVINLGGRKTGLVFARNGLVAFDPVEGRELFKYPFRARSYNAVNASNVIVKDDQVFLTESYEHGSTLLKVTNNQVDPIWSAGPRQKSQGLSCHWNTPILVDGYVYGCASRHRGDAEMRCIELATGKVQWIARPKWKDEPAGRSSLTYADGHFLYFSEEGWLFLIKADPSRFEQIAAWNGQSADAQHELKYPCWAAPVLSHGLVYLRGKGRLVSVDVTSQE